jgi:hypothetical protein
MAARLIALGSGWSGLAARFKTFKIFFIFFIFLLHFKKIIIDPLQSAGKYAS